MTPPNMNHVAPGFSLAQAVPCRTPSPPLLCSLHSFPFSPAKQTPVTRRCIPVATAKPSEPVPAPRPEPALRTHALALACGLLASTTGSLIGAGGGIVLTPLLTALARLRQHQAHGTSLCVVAATAVISAARYGFSAAVDPSAAVALAAAALVTAPIGARFSARVDSTVLRRYFGAFLVAVSCLIPLLPYVSGGAVVLVGLLRATMLVGLGAVTGFLSGLLGIGGGTVNVPALVLLAGFPQALAQGTAMLAMVLPSLRGALAHAKLGHVEGQLLPGLLVGAVSGGFIGSSVALVLPETTLRFLCAVIFAAMGLKYMLPKRKQS